MRALSNRMSLPVVAAFLICGCAETGVDPLLPTADQPEAAGAAATPVIGYLKSRDYRVAIHPGGESAAGSEWGGSPTFTISTSDGRVLGAGLSEGEFEARFPTLSEGYRAALVEPVSFGSLPEFR